MDKEILELNKPRLGLINYINCLPVVLPIIRGLIKLDAQVILGEPTKLNSLFANGELEYGAMSAFAFLEQSEQLQLIPTVSISSQGRVNSVLLFSREPIGEYPPAVIAVPSGSATSINAMLLMLSSFNKKRAMLKTVEKPDLEDNNLDAALVIGDRALLVDEAWSKKYHRYDLGQWWYEAFNLPMVFGVFAVRTSWFIAGESKINQQILIEQFSTDLAKAGDLGLNDHFDLVLDEAEARTGLGRNRLKQYYKSDLDFSWSAGHQLAMEKYELLCRQNGILADKKVLA